jgi:uncharacterized protein (DUF1810 family)
VFFDNKKKLNDNEKYLFMYKQYNIDRFIDAQNKGNYGGTYKEAIVEMNKGHKSGHWIWYCLPCIINIAKRPSSTSQLFAIKNFYEAIDYIRNDILRQRLVDMYAIILDQLNKNVQIQWLMGSDIDVDKLKSCVTLFYYVVQCIIIPDIKELVEQLYKKIGGDSDTFNIIKDDYVPLICNKLA